MKYTTAQIVALGAKLETELAPHGIHIAVGGSCVYAGGSDKDMDVFLYPHGKEDINRVNAVALLASLGFTKMRPTEEIEHTMVPDVHVTVGPDEVRVDFFFLSRIYTAPNK